jgi:hypothetical protein
VQGLITSVVVGMLGLWMGSLVHLLLSIFSLFGRFPSASSEVAVEAAPALFAMSERYHLVLAFLSLTGCVMLRLSACSRLRKALMWVVLLAGLVACGSTLLISSRIDALRVAGERGGEAFRRYHAASNVAYLLQSALVVTAFGMSVATSRQDATKALTPRVSQPSAGR